MNNGVQGNFNKRNGTTNSASAPFIDKSKGGLLRFFPYGIKPTSQNAVSTLDYPIETKQLPASSDLTTRYSWPRQVFYHSNGLGVSSSRFAYGNGVWVATLSGTSSLRSSTDGITWTTRTNPHGSSLSDVVFGGGMFLAVGAGIVMSTDAVTWTTAGWFGQYSIGQGFRTVAYHNGLWTIGVSANSSNGWITTNPSGLGVGDYGQINLVGTNNASRFLRYNNGLWVCVSTLGTAVRTSTDGVNFTSRSINISNPDGLAYGNGMWMVVGNTSGQVMTSTDGITWVSKTSVGTGIYALEFFNGLFYAGGLNNLLFTSVDGVVWTQQNANFGSSGTQIRGIGANDDVLLMGDIAGNARIHYKNPKHAAPVIQPVSASFSNPLNSAIVGWYNQ